MVKMVYKLKLIKKLIQKLNYKSTLIEIGEYGAPGEQGRPGADGKPGNLLKIFINPFIRDILFHKFLKKVNQVDQELMVNQALKDPKVQLD